MPPTIKAGNLEKYAVNLQDETNKKHIYFLNDPTPKSRKQEDNLNFLCRGKSILMVKYINSWLKVINQGLKEIFLLITLFFAWLKKLPGHKSQIFEEKCELK